MPVHAVKAFPEKFKGRKARKAAQQEASTGSARADRNADRAVPKELGSAECQSMAPTGPRKA